MSKHDHTECEHDLKYCKHCDVVYCATCDREWKKPEYRLAKDTSEWFVKPFKNPIDPPYTVTFTDAAPLSNRHIHS